MIKLQCQIKANARANFSCPGWQDHHRNPASTILPQVQLSNGPSNARIRNEWLGFCRGPIGEAFMCRLMVQECAEPPRQDMKVNFPIDIMCCEVATTSRILTLLGNISRILIAVSADTSGFLIRRAHQLRRKYPCISYQQF